MIDDWMVDYPRTIEEEEREINRVGKWLNVILCVLAVFAVYLILCGCSSSKRTATHTVTHMTSDSSEHVTETKAEAVSAIFAQTVETDGVIEWTKTEYYPAATEETSPSAWHDSDTAEPKPVQQVKSVTKGKAQLNKQSSTQKEENAECSATMVSDATKNTTISKMETAEKKTDVTPPISWKLPLVVLLAAFLLWKIRALKKK